MIDVDGDQPGRVNGLSLADPGDDRFGRPTRVTTGGSRRRGGVEIGGGGGRARRPDPFEGFLNSWLIDQSIRRKST